MPIALRKFISFNMTLCSVLCTPVTYANLPANSFTSAEHMTIGNQVLLRSHSNEPGKSGMPLQLANGLRATYGEIIAVGDFYEIPKKPVSQGKDEAERKVRFLNAYQSFANNPDAVQEAKRILDTVHNEYNLIQSGMQHGEAPEAIYERISSDEDRQFNCITGGGCAAGTWWLHPGRYLDLANMDFDHFGTDAWITYRVGHELALEQAARAGQTQDSKLLETAYTMNAFACHFLSDRFSAGHIRTPRAELYAHVTPSVTGSLLSSYMHNEESELALHVHNKRGEHWTAFGDRSYFSNKNPEHKRLIQATLQASADEVFAAYEQVTTRIPDQVINMIPEPDEVGSNSRQDISPLFYWNAQTEKLMRRADMNNPYDKHWTDDWWGWSTLIELKQRRGLTLREQGELARSEWREEAVRTGLITEQEILDEIKKR